MSKVPDLREPEGLSRAILTVGAAFGASYGQMRRLDQRGPLGSLTGQVLTYAAVSRLVWGLLRNGPRFRERYGSLAYQEAFYRYLLPAAGAMAASVAHIATVPGTRTVSRLLAVAPGLYLLATGVGLLSRAVRALGVDTAAAVEVYFPEEGRLVTWSAYRILRHPLYAAAARVVVGLALLRGKVRGLTLAALHLGWLHLWAQLEEGELERRFGPSYEAYREQVPAGIIPDSLERERRLLALIRWGEYET
ncbi:MAG: isoprenylcysteine carboxylmethyltransferase family protein [Chloroflexi bacterium]|nr:isoprenylcysteine carboxylmethyltransferase family protein [Chloroflexota bacterium]